MDDTANIRGEYWIQNGSIDFVDGDIGDQTHESVAIQQVVSEYMDSIKILANDVGIDNSQIEKHGEINKIISNIVEKLQETKNITKQQADIEIMKFLGCNKEAYKILQGGGDASFYVMKYMDWIAIRSNNIELYGYNETKRKYLMEGLNEILDSEGIDENTPLEDIEFSFYDHKTKRSNYITMEEIENPHPIMHVNQNIYTKTNKYLNYKTNKDSEENKGQNYQKSLPSKMDIAAKKFGIIGPGQNLWRGTSEGFQSFSEWLDCN